MPNRPVGSILYSSVRLDMADSAVRSVLDCSIRFDVRDCLVIAVRNPLCVGGTTAEGKQCNQYESQSSHFTGH